MNDFLKNGKLVIWGVVGIIGVVIFLSLWPFRTVPTGYRGVVTQFGAIKGIEPEGLVFVPPWKTLTVFNIRTETTDVPRAQGSTADTQPVDVALTVRYSIQPDKVAEVFEKYSRDGDLSSYVQTATQEVFKSVTAKYTAPDLIAKRSQVSSDTFAALNSALSIYGAHVVRVDFQNFEFGKDYMAAINDKVTQEQKRLAAENQLKTVEAQQKQKVAVADAEAKATLLTAQAAAESLRIQSAAIAANKDILELKRIEVQKIEAERWDGHRVPNQYYGSAAIPVVNNK